ncbi:MAG TPA: HAMP domain-containing sensor histidine kinase [Gaiellaceae bacterium]|nr:HAMP domain-containing sensor histidine kinase [Gaiellaceae bacterium]
MDSHRHAVDKQRVELGELLGEAAETARPAARAKNIVLGVDTESPQHVVADRPQLLRLVDNLLANAIKFTLAGGTVRLVARGNAATATLEVTDTGVGITSADRPDLFKRFFRGTIAIEKAIPGSGLALAISKVIAEAHGTTIQVENTAGAESTFRVAFPAA